MQMFKYLRDIIDSTPDNVVIDTTRIQYTEPDTGIVWFLPEGSRLWYDVYLPWLAQGNTPDPAI